MFPPFSFLSTPTCPSRVRRVTFLPPFRTVISAIAIASPSHFPPVNNSGRSSSSNPAYTLPETLWAHYSIRFGFGCTREFKAIYWKALHTYTMGFIEKLQASMLSPAPRNFLPVTTTPYPRASRLLCQRKIHVLTIHFLQKSSSTG